MAAKLSKEQADALNAQGDGRLEVVDPETNRIYFIVDADTLNHLEQRSAREAIERGLADMQAGHSAAVQDVHASLREELRSRHGQ